MDMPVSPAAPSAMQTPMLTCTLPCPQQSPPVTLVLGDESCWLSCLPLVSGEPDANAVIYRKGWYLRWGRGVGTVMGAALVQCWLQALLQAIVQIVVRDTVRCSV